MATKKQPKKARRVTPKAKPGAAARAKAAGPKSGSRKAAKSSRGAPAKTRKGAAKAKSPARRAAPAKAKAKAPARRAAPAKAKAPARRAPAKAKAKSPARPAVASPPARAARAVKAPAPIAKPAVRRRDRAGHLDPAYAADLRARGRSDRAPRDPEAFIERPRASDDLVEELGEEFVSTATTGEYEAEDTRNQEVTEEIGGPFVTSTGGQEFAGGTDASNPKGSTREPFPRT